ncbi:hypothetical protein KVF89_26205 [Nocardioides carbamazepini]|uniref:hypothetical protein n=1 Tax=Nocardioides carbamazepini TaxID=2854259 RepID=UPI002149CD87|nr:hypothetical protein [Nocardioides carbamazepini]MCR1786055.1 hypothetical protein [Nocardioides carbamazepini]
MRAPRIPALLSLPSSGWPAAACAATAAVLTLSACSGGSTDAEADAEARATPAERPAPAFTGVRHELPTGAALDNDPDLYEHVAQTGCEATADGWKAEGSAENTGTEARTFVVLVLFTDPQGRSVDSASASVTVGPGETGDWIAERDFDAPAGTLCVVRAVNQAK